jgi:catechol 2,3-dioxygenase-like lactoylglutathione lyase family enzyme
MAIPQDAEEEARPFYGGVLGLMEVTKPAELAEHGGLWFVLGDGIGLHLGVDPQFHAATKAHPGLIVVDLGALKKRLLELGIGVASGVDPMGRKRVYVGDPFGNRVELIEATSDKTRALDDSGAPWLGSDDEQL